MTAPAAEPDRLGHAAVDERGLRRRQRRRLGPLRVQAELGLDLDAPRCTQRDARRTPARSTRPTATDGLYDFRAVAIDGVNLTGASAAVTSRRIDNTAPTATMGALAANLSGSVSLTSTPADSGTGVASVQYQYKLTSDSTWTERLLVLDVALHLPVQHRRR